VLSSEVVSSSGVSVVSSAVASGAVS